MAPLVTELYSLFHSNIGAQGVQSVLALCQECATMTTNHGLGNHGLGNHGLGNHEVVQLFSVNSESLENVIL